MSRRNKNINKTITDAATGLQKELALTKQKLEAAKRQSANRLIGLCKCGIEREELTTKLEAAEQAIRELNLTRSN